MTEREIKRSLNKPVRFTNPKLYLEGVTYILTGAMIRLGADGFYYQAELTDPTTEHSIIYCRLEEVESETKNVSILRGRAETSPH